MAQEVTVSPTLGHGLLYTQGGVGTAPGYDAIDLRRMIEGYAAGYEGVIDPAGWKVGAHSTAGQMKVDVAANRGLAVVEGDAVTNQSRYVVAPHSSTITLDVPAADPTLPRVDRVVLRVYDAAHDGSGRSAARVELLRGTPSTGATRDNRTGQPALPGSCIELAVVVVPPAATSITIAAILDVRQYAIAAASIGEQRFLSGATVPPGFVPGDGRQIRRDQHPRYVAEVGNAQGAGNGSTTVNVADMTDRVPLGKSGTRALGSRGGETQEALTTAHMPKHGHGSQTGTMDANWQHGHDLALPYASAGGVASGSGVPTHNGDPVGGNLTGAVASVDLNHRHLIPDEGGDQPHNNMQPYTALTAAVFTGGLGV